MKATETVFQKLLDGKMQYVVPLYQRTYSWEQKQWEQIWDDLIEVYSLEFPRNHFIGSVVTQQIPTAPEGTSRYTLIDGQQRMTTLFILLSVIRKHADEVIYGSLADEIQNTCLINMYSSGGDRNKLMPTERDRQAFNALLDGGELPKGDQIQKAVAHFEAALQEGDAAGESINLRKLHQCIVNHLDMVSIHLEPNDSPNRIFESLNNTGMPLSVADLIRNYLLMHIPDVDQQEKAYVNHWYPMQTLLTDGPRDRSADFFWRYLMMDGSLPRQDDTYDEIQDRVKTPTPDEAIGTLKTYAKFAKYYGQIAELDTSGLSPKLATQFSRLNQWEVDVAYPYLMSALDLMHSGQVSEDELVAVTQSIESFVVRRTVCGVPTNQLRRIFAQVAGQIDPTDVAAYTYDRLSDNRWPSDAAFKNSLISFRLYLPSRLNRTRLILDSLEESFCHKESPDLTQNITIEHVMPQTLSGQWIEYLKPDAYAVHEQWLDTIGNLTLTGYNPELSNKSFDEKKEILAGSNLELNGSLQCFNIWNADSILARANDLADRALKIWKR